MYVLYIILCNLCCYGTYSNAMQLILLFDFLGLQQRDDVVVNMICLRDNNIMQLVLLFDFPGCNGSMLIMKLLI